jgi:hypothetical protein
MTDARDPAPFCLRRTRLAVLGVLLATALVVASGYGLLPLLKRPLPVPDFVTPRLFGSVLIGLVVTSFALLRGLGSRAALRDPATRAERFFASRVTAAAVGAQAASLGLLYAATLRPAPDELAPFWVAALACVALAFPRGYELSDLDPTREPPP